MHTHRAPRVGGQRRRAPSAPWPREDERDSGPRVGGLPVEYGVLQDRLEYVERQADAPKVGGYGQVRRLRSLRAVVAKEDQGPL